MGDKAEKDRQQQQADAEVEKIKITIEKVKVDVPQNARPKLDEILQSVVSLVAHYKQQREASQLPAEKPPVAGQPLPGQPAQPK